MEEITNTDKLAFAGSFGIENKPLAYNLYNLNLFDKHLFRNVPLKENEQLFRFSNKTISQAKAEKPLIKININQQLAYFVSNNTKQAHKPLFDNTPYKLKNLALLHKIYKNGGEIKSNKLAEAINKAYQIGVKSYPKKEVPAQNKELMDLMEKLNLQVGEGIPLMKAYNQARFDENEKEIRDKFPELYTPKFKKGGEIDNYIAKRLKNKKTAYNYVYDRLLKIAPNLLNLLHNAKYVSDVYGKSQYRTEDFGGNDAYMALSIEGLEKDNKGRYVIAIAHYYLQNGDMMCDPCMTVRLDEELKTVEALSFKMDGILGGRVKNVYGKMPNGNLGVNLVEKKSQNSFLNTWSSNWVKQGHKIKFKEIEATETINPVSEQPTLLDLQKRLQIAKKMAKKNPELKSRVKIIKKMIKSLKK